jgi:hypothetical protein
VCHANSASISSVMWSVALGSDTSSAITSSAIALSFDMASVSFTSTLPLNDFAFGAAAAPVGFLPLSGTETAGTAVVVDGVAVCSFCVTSTFCSAAYFFAASGSISRSVSLNVAVAVAELETVVPAVGLSVGSAEKVAARRACADHRLQNLARSQLREVQIPQRVASERERTDRRLVSLPVKFSQLRPQMDR